MGWFTIPLLWAQASGSSMNPNALAPLALRRWCSGLTLSSSQAAPSLDGLWAFLAGLGTLAIIVLIIQGPGEALKQLCDIPGHVRLARSATRRVWRASRIVAAAITFTVLAWTGSQTLNFILDRADKGRADLGLLTRSRTLPELALEQGMLAALTPLRDLAALGDNLCLLTLAVYLVFRASSDGPFRPGIPARRPSRHRSSAWTTVLWGCGSLYILYRMVAKAARTTDLPVGGCLAVEAVLIPLLMMICDGFLLAWFLAELRGAGFDEPGDERFHPGPAIELMPAAALACLLAMPARYVATLVFLASQHLPTSVGATRLGQYIRWQLGWGLVDLQAAALTAVAMAGVVAWSRGSLHESLIGYRRLLAGQGGHLIATLVMTGAATCLFGGIAYPLVLLLPAANWVLAAADSYSHYATLPVGLWTLAALIELAQRTLPTAETPMVPSEPEEIVAAEAEAGVPAFNRTSDFPDPHHRRSAPGPGPLPA